jgi:hypothetical protein
VSGDADRESTSAGNQARSERRKHGLRGRLRETEEV